VMGSGGRLDVHVDFNLIRGRELHRRLNILVFLNRSWDDAWGGELELWDAAVRNRGRAIRPVFNRCAVFETSEISFHGVTKVTCPPGRTRNSFAAYYYTREAPEGWDGRRHSTVFRARPDERLRGRVLMPLARMRSGLRDAVRRLRRGGQGDRRRAGAGLGPRGRGPARPGDLGPDPHAPDPRGHGP